MEVRFKMAFEKLKNFIAPVDEERTKRTKEEEVEGSLQKA